MGSLKANKFWNKKWISIKKTLSLSNKQRELIIGSLLGDGTMRVGKNAIHANFKTEHGLVQKDYVFYKYNILRNFVFTQPKLSFRYREDREKYPKSWWFRTIRHPSLTKIYNNFYTREKYRTGRKIIPNDLIHDLTPFVLAVWIMDDGSFNQRTIDISTYSFSLQEILYLKSMFQKLFDIEASFYKDRDKGYRMYFRRKENDALIQIIRPYIIPSMMYKIGF